MRCVRCKSDNLIWRAGARERELLSHQDNHSSRGHRQGRRTGREERERERARERERETERETDRQTDRQTDRAGTKQAEVQSIRLISLRRNKQTQI